MTPINIPLRLRLILLPLAFALAVLAALQWFVELVHRYKRFPMRLPHRCYGGEAPEYSEASLTDE